MAVAKSTKSRIIIFEGQQIVFEFNFGENGEIYLEYIRGPPGHYNGLVSKSIPISEKKDDVKDDWIDNKFKKMKKPKRYNESHIIPKIKLTNYWSALETEESDTDCEESEDKESISNKEENIHDAKRAKVEVEPRVEGEATVEVEAKVDLEVVSGQSGDIQLPCGGEFRTIYFNLVSQFYSSLSPGEPGQPEVVTNRESLNGDRYECDQCHYKGKHFNSLKQHRKSRHGSEEFVCDSCDYMSRKKKKIFLTILLGNKITLLLILVLGQMCPEITCNRKTMATSLTLLKTVKTYGF